MDMLNDITGTEVKLPFLNTRLGNYVLEIEAMRGGKSRSDGNEFLATDVKVVESSGDNAFPAGTRAVVLIKKDKFGYYKKEIPQLVSAIINEPASAVKGDIIAPLISEEQPAKGLKFGAEVAPPKPGKTFNQVNFRPVTVSNGKKAK